MLNQWGYPPQSGVVYVPQPPTNNGGFDIDGITRQIAGLEALKKLMKEEKKDDKKKDEDKGPNILTVALFMMLLSPITGPIMSWFFDKGLSALHHAN